MGYGLCRHLSGRYVGQLHQFNLVSRFAGRQAERENPQVRPCGNLFAYRRHVHAFHAVGTSGLRRLGMEHLRFRMAMCRCRTYTQLYPPEGAQQPRNDLLRWHGMQHSGGDETFIRLPYGDGSRTSLMVVARWRCFVHPWGAVLLATQTVYARSVPPVLSRRKHRTYYRYLVYFIGIHRKKRIIPIHTVIE